MIDEKVSDKIDQTPINELDEESNDDMQTNNLIKIQYEELIDCLKKDYELALKNLALFDEEIHEDEKRNLNLDHIKSIRQRLGLFLDEYKIKQSIPIKGQKIPCMVYPKENKDIEKYLTAIHKDNAKVRKYIQLQLEKIEVFNEILEGIKKEIDDINNKQLQISSSKKKECQMLEQKLRKKEIEISKMHEEKVQLFQSNIDKKIAKKRLEASKDQKKSVELKCKTKFQTVHSGYQNVTFD